MNAISKIGIDTVVVAPTLDGVIVEGILNDGSPLSYTIHHHFFMCHLAQCQKLKNTSYTDYLRDNDITHDALHLLTSLKNLS